MVSFGCNNLPMELSFDSIDTPALTKAQLAKMLFEQIGLNKREAFLTWKSNLHMTYKQLSQAIGSTQVNHQSDFFLRLFIQPIRGYENQIRIPLWA